jgi:flagellin FlaB
MRKNWTKMRRDRRADIGIGTMIVFIAMVLVAAVAAAVLISTANQVREQATSTGDQAINNVASGFIKESVVAHVAADNLIDTIDIRLRLAAGSPNVYIKNCVVKVIWAANDKSLVWGAAASATAYGAALDFEADDATHAFSDFIVKQGDLLKITIGTTAAGAMHLDLNNLQSMEVQIIPGFGQSTLLNFVTPEVYLGTYVTLG